MTTLFEPVKAKLAHHFNIPEADITPDATFADLGLDSLGAVELLCVLQDELGLRLPADDMLRSADTTIAQAVAAVEAAQLPAGGNSPGAAARADVVISA